MVGAGCFGSSPPSPHQKISPIAKKILSFCPAAAGALALSSFSENPTRIANFTFAMVRTAAGRAAAGAANANANANANATTSPLLLLLLLLLLSPSPSLAANNGLALRPLRGWCSWNLFHRNISDALFRGTADAMASNGMLAAGYDRVHIDGGWWMGVDTGKIVRNATGFFQVDPSKFPYGLADLISYVNAKGFAWGHYTDAGTHACNGDAPMSEGYEKQDVALFAEWGVAGVKIDACSVHEPAETVMERWAQLLNATGKPILVSNCRNACMGNPPTFAPWCKPTLNMARSSGDINATWGSMLHNIDSLRGFGNVSGPGFWMDPDFLEVGIGEFAWAADGSTAGMNRAHFGLWVVTSSPLIAGLDLRPEAQPPQQLIDLLTTPRALAVHEDYAAGNAGDFLREAAVAGTEVWAKPLSGGGSAALLFNRASASPSDISVSFAELPGLRPAGATSCIVTDVWGSGPGTRVSGGTYTASGVAPRDAAFVTVTNCTA
jgi:alpha-galactosidase